MKRAGLWCVRCVLFLQLGASGVVYGNVSTKEADERESLEQAEASFVEAQEALASGNIQQGIAALERVLQINPGLSNVQFELGRLYLQYGALTRGEYYLRESLKDPEMPDAYRQQAVQQLTYLEGRSRHEFSSRVGLALDSHTNPASLSDSLSAFNGQAYAIRDNNSVIEKDIALRPSLSIDHRYRVSERDDSLFWQNSVGAVGEFYTDQDTLNSVNLNIRSGFDYLLHQTVLTANPVRYNPYVQVRLGHSNDESFAEDAEGNTTATGADWGSDYYGVGAGFTATKTGNRFRSSVTLDFMNMTYEDERDQGKDGTLFNATHRADFKLTQSLSPFYSLGLSKASLDDDFESYVGQSLGLGLMYKKQGPGLKGLQVTIDTRLARQDYDALDLRVSDVEKRVDTKWTTGVSSSLPLSDRLSVTASVSVVSNKSSLVNYRYEDVIGSLGMSWRF